MPIYLFYCPTFKLPPVATVTAAPGRIFMLKGLSSLVEQIKKQES